eukprot:8797184-Pyramimonas_sp.AAC.1
MSAVARSSVVGHSLVVDRWPSQAARGAREPEAIARDLQRGRDAPVARAARDGEGPERQSRGG